MNFYRNSQSFEQNMDNLKGPLRGFGHACGVRVLKMDRPAAGGFLSLTALRAEGCGIALTVHSEHILKER